MSSRWVWSFWEAAVESLSEARTAVSSAKVAMEVRIQQGRNCWKRCFLREPHRGYIRSQCSPARHQDLLTD
jgi:hypothetical protein